MKVEASAMPVSSFTIQKVEEQAELRFYANVEEVIVPAADGKDAYTQYRYDEYIITRPWKDSLVSEVESNYDAWFRQAKAEDEMKNPPNVNQLRADIDYVMVMADLI